MELEQKILASFIKHMGKEVEGLELFVAWIEDTWPDDEGIYSCQVMETKTNGKVWDCECTKSGKIKSVYEL